LTRTFDPDWLPPWLVAALAVRPARFVMLLIELKEKGAQMQIDRAMKRRR
jgi:hypothetical protein